MSDQRAPSKASADPRPVATVVVNPTAGHGRARRLLPAVTEQLVSGLPGYNVRVQQTDSFEDAKLRAHAVVDTSERRTVTEGEPPDLLLMMGGDGMASLGANACAGTQVRLGVIPAGTGNDFCRGMGLPITTMEAVAGIVAGGRKQVDLLEVSGELTYDEHHRYVGSVVSTGYDAKVNWRTNHHKVSLGSLTYGYDALAELAAFQPLEYRMDIDGVSREQDAMLVAVGNAGFIGGGMQICPNADPSDGLIDITIVHPVGRMKLIRLLPQLYSGKFAEDPCVELLRAKHVHIDGPNLLPMADGEELGSVPLDIGIAAGTLGLVGAE
jgi:diacylglycerol kinase (ATP)